MISIAREILLHDKVRFIITVVSLGFAIVMIVYDMGMFFSVTGESVSLIDCAQANLWVFEKGSGQINAPSLVPKSVLGRARSMEGVQQVCALGVLMGTLKVRDNRQVMIVGIDPACPLLRPWNVVEGDIQSLERKDTIIVDDLALRGDPAHVGDVVKINDWEVRVVAVTHKNKSFSSPFVYVNLKTFASLRGTPEDYSFVMIQLAPAADQDQIIQRLTDANSDVAVSDPQEFKRSTIAALIAAGVGMIFVVVAVGVMVGMLIITLTVYTATLEQLRNFAILKSLGATQWQVLRIVLEQAITQTAVSFGIGLAASLGVDAFVEALSGINGQLPLPVIIGSLGMMIVLAILASLISIRKAVAVDPVMVFRA